MSQPVEALPPTLPEDRWEGWPAWVAFWRTQWAFLSISIGEKLVYRGDFILASFMRFLPIVTQIFLWSAVFQAVQPADESLAEQEIVGYTYRNFIAYYLLTMISRAFSSMPGLASGIARDVREGTIKKFLIQPVDMLGFLFWHRVAHKLIYYVMAAGPFAVLFFLCRSYFDGWPEPSVLAAFLASLVMAFLLGFLLEATIGCISFWFLEVSSLLFVYMLFNFFFSGHMFPIDMLPGIWRTLVELMPFQYLAYFPSAVFLGKIQGNDLAWGLATQAAWVVFFLCASQLAFRQGMKRYSGYGG